MPTGGGKSLCYQMPALILGRTAIVISPLIALMQDQAAQLAEMGIPAAVLNSALEPREQSRVMRNATQGAYRLLYLSPERLARQETIGWLRNVALAFFAIDEAHCISEWGHEFRPEYRQLSLLRENFPGQPIAAFTASATRRVRHDILHQLQLRHPHKYILSFYRPNLRYLVRQCDARTQARLLAAALGAHKDGSVIVYAPTIARVEETVDSLAAKGIAAVPYHGKMDSESRRRNQERWMSDEVRILVGTIAFGLGINKATVRAVIHLSLPKSIEQYYQEAGRAGRDGQPSDCALLWQKRDAGLLAHFIRQIEDPDETGRAWQRYRTIRGFAESETCRHHQICSHFGETPAWEQCGACDACGEAPEWLAAAQPEQVEPVRKKRARKPSPEPVTQPVTAAPVDANLLDYLREWRRQLAKRKRVPAFMVLPDASLLDVCRLQPDNHAELLQVTGIGERKAELYGDEILSALARFRGGARAGAPAAPKGPTPAEQTTQLLGEGRSFEEIASIRARQLSTVIGMVADLVENGDVEFRDEWVPAESRLLIEEAAAKHGLDRLKPIRNALPSEVPYDHVRLAVAWLRREQTANPGEAASDSDS
jgi:ATP-dependent DNA helicase RecQ